MDVPGFDEFLASVDWQALNARLAAGAPMQLLQVRAGTFSEQQTAALEEIYRQAVRTATELNLAYLRVYHEWLASNL